MVSSRPLEGLTVLDVTRVVAGPYCSMMLADMGARVIKIENPIDADYTRKFPPFLASGNSAFFAQYNRNKTGLSLNLKSDEGKKILKQLATKSDVLVENFRPRTLSKLGIGYEVLKKLNPKLVYTAISGFGQTGPKSNRPSFDNTGQAESGLWSMNGYPNMPPVRVGTIVGDLAACLYGTIGTLAAVRQAEKTGVGQMVDVSQVDSTLALTESAVMRFDLLNEDTKPLGNEHSFVRPYEQFPCKDGYVFFGGYKDNHWETTLEIFGDLDLAKDPEIDSMEKRFDSEVYERRIRPLINGWFSKFGKDELEEMLAEKVPLSPIKTIGEVINDAQTLSRNMIIDMPVDDTFVKMLGTPIKLSASDEPKLNKAPDLGEHNFDILTELLEMDADQIAGLKLRGII